MPKAIKRLSNEQYQRVRYDDGSIQNFSKIDGVFKKVRPEEMPNQIHWDMYGVLNPNSTWYIRLYRTGDVV